MLRLDFAVIILNPSRTLTASRLSSRVAESTSEERAKVGCSYTSTARGTVGYSGSQRAERCRLYGSSFGFIDG